MRDNAQSEMKIARTLIIHESVFGNERSKACLHFLLKLQIPSDATCLKTHTT